MLARLYTIEVRLPDGAVTREYRSFRNLKDELTLLRDRYPDHESISVTYAEAPRGPQ